MKKIIYFLAALIAFSVTSCKDDDVVFNNVDDLDRLPMPMFRKKHNTNVSDETDQFASKVMTGYRNAIQLHWYGVEGAKEYEIRYAIGLTSGNEEDWQDPARNVTYVTVPADQLHYEIYNLEYATDYRFCIRAIHPTDPAKNSKWYGMGGGREWEDYLGITTDIRYAVPFVLRTDDKDYDAFTVYLNLDYNRSSYSKEDADTIERRFNIVNGKFVATHLMVQPSPVNPEAAVPEEWKSHRLTQEELVPGEDGFIKIRVTGLQSNAVYNVALYDETNTAASAEVDKYYNYYPQRTKGDPGQPILIKHKVATSIWVDPDAQTEPDMNLEQRWLEAEQKYQACRLDTVFSKFITDISLAEGQTFYLEGGKAYYLRQGPNLNKGFTLCTDPADILAGKGRAKVYMGGILQDGTNVSACNWNLGKEKQTGEFDAPIRVEDIIMQDIDFDCPLAINFGMVQEGVGAVTANYFVNNLSKTLPFEYSSFQLRNCTVQHAIRGFFRAQGNAKKVINQIVIDNCVFMNLGYYNANGMDYRFIHGELNNPEDNITKDIQITNNTFYDTTLSHMVSTIKDKVADFASDVVWNIRIENNTFVNLSTRSGRPFINYRSIAGDSKITFKRNLICLAKDDADNRPLKQTSMDLRPVISGSGKIELDICENYSAGCLEKHMVDDGIFDAAKSAFSSTSNNAGYYANLGMLTPGLTSDDLIVRVGSTPLRADELFQDPNPKYHATGADDTNSKMHYIDPETIWNRLQYKNDLKVTTHEIYTKNIGDQRWKTAEPKWFYPTGSSVPTPWVPAE